METILGKHWHHLPAEEVCELLDTRPQAGLDLFDIAERQRQFGPNQLPERSGPGPVRRFLQQFRQPLVYLLVLAGGVTLYLREWVDAVVILGVVLLNAVIGFLQEAKAVQALAALSRSMRTQAVVLRGGRRDQVPSDSLVPGDVVLLQSGDKVPADLRLIASRELRVDESALTGESLPVTKGEPRLPADTPLAERLNMAYSSSLVTYGQGTGVVVATGTHTEIGRISDLIANADELDTPLTKRIAEFTRLLLWIILVLAAVTFLVGLLRGEPAADMFMAAVALAVGAIPEGLPAAVTIVLAIGVARMAKRRAVIRKLPAVETLGSTTVVCSDKTGTLTENQMTVRAIWAGGEHFTVTGTGYQTQGEYVLLGDTVQPQESPVLMACLKAGALCNDAQLRPRGDCEREDFELQGDPTEGALLVAAEKAGCHAESLRQTEPRRDVIPFESQHQYMATLHGVGTHAVSDGESSERRSAVVYFKGAVEKVVTRCEWMLDADGSRRLLDEAAVRHEADAMASRGLRVLAIATREMLPECASIIDRDLETGLTLLGLQGMLDPPRPEAIAAVRTCQAAGVQVKMITGDHSVTARAIAEQLGVLPLPTPGRRADRIYTGQQLATLADEKLIEVAQESSVFARVTPEQKLRLVRALQARGHVVAMTGDGVNDGPALKQADIGIAMGRGGTEVAKEAGDVVLTDDNFATIEAAIEEGRGVFDNLTKFIVWTLPTNLGEGLVIFVATMLGVTLPILPLQILWINLTTSVFLGLALAFEPKESGIMLRPPRDSRQPILTRELLGRVLLVGSLLLVASFGLFEWSLLHGDSPEKARTIAVCVFVFGEMAYLLNCRSLQLSVWQVGLFSNRWLWLGIAVMTGLQLLFIYQPVMQRLFHTAPLSWSDWLEVAAASLTISLSVGVEKWLRRRALAARPNPSHAPLANIAFSNVAPQQFLDSPRPKQPYYPKEQHGVVDHS